MSTRSIPSGGRERLLEAGLFLILVGSPLVFAPFAFVSFANPKFVLLALGAVLITAARPHHERRLAILAAVWLAGLFIASIAGLDFWWSITGSEIQNAGVITLAASALMLCVAPPLSQELRERLPSWIFWTGVIVGGVAVLGRFVPFGGQTWSLGSLAATMGHRVYVGGFLAVAAMAAIPIAKRRSHYAGLVLIGSGLAVSAVRAAWVGAAVGALVIVLIERRLFRAVVWTFVPVAVVLAAWTLASSRLPESSIDYSAAQRFTELTEGSAVQRPPVVRAYIDGFVDDPLLGSGPATGWYVFLRNVDPGEIKVAGRGYADAHNIVAELAGTTGLVGIVPLLALALLSAIRMRGAPADRRWALGGAISLAIFHFLQPLNVVLTPLMFLLVGLALRSPQDRERVTLPKWVLVVPLIALALATARLASSTLDRYGYNYASERSYRWAIRIEPHALAPHIRLAKHLALDARSGDRAAGTEARQIVTDLIDAHAWHPQVRLNSADVLALLDDLPAANRLLTDHLEVFPNDPRALFAGMNLSLRLDRHEEAEARARTLLSIDPESREARRVVRGR